MSINVFDGRLAVFGQLGEDAFRRLVHAFYSRVYADPLLRPMFPDDRPAAEERLSLFLMQYFGGPTTYSERRGHPRLRMRHLPFSIGQRERDAWLGHMLAAMDEVGIAEPARAAMIDYFEHAATFMINRD
ncbi:MAG TPA: globin [Chloroflexota bacterium]|nr:globin [Chloroflexota bacterium]